uniref:MD-2-related lipid-recognition domain-containing protein n=1 Tax=Amphimedon queenslandica TaxID=400682 RepID=A0A1X7UZ49_AMPQE
MKIPIFVIVAFSIAITLSGNLAVDGSGPITWKDCSNNVSVMKIKNITFDPPGDVYPGQGFSLKATFKLKKEITEGKVNVDVQYGVLHYATGVYDLCDKFKEAGLTCPVSKGLKNGVFQGRVPFPNGYFKFTINATTSAGDKISCFTFELNDNI